MLKEYPNILKKEEKEFIKNNFLQNDAFSWYLNHIDVDKDYEFNNVKKNYWPFFSHSILTLSYTHLTLTTKCSV